MSGRSTTKGRSLCEAVEAEGATNGLSPISRTDHSGIAVGCEEPLSDSEGQSAPSEGLCIRKYNFGLNATHDVIIGTSEFVLGNIPA